MNTEVKITLFRNLYDTKTDKQMEFSSFDEFENLLYKLSRQKRKGKRDSSLISPACYLQSSDRRCNANVAYWSAWAAVDVDNHNFSSQNLETELLDSFSNFRFVCYSTASSTIEAPKFRLVFPLTTKVDAARIRHFWYALNMELGKLGDPQTKDLSRMYYIPAAYDGAHNFIFSNTGGASIDPVSLMQKHEFVNPAKTSSNFLDRLPESMQKQIIQHRKESLEKQRPRSWSSYRDCPFVNQELIREYKAIAHVDNTGRYAMIYKIMVSIASSAIKSGYAITTKEIVNLIQELDLETSQRYQNRPLDVEADRALEFAYRNM